jgi:hypothetical protein
MERGLEGLASPKRSRPNSSGPPRACHERHADQTMFAVALRTSRSDGGRLASTSGRLWELQALSPRR